MKYDDKIIVAMSSSENDRVLRVVAMVFTPLSLPT